MSITINVNTTWKATSNAKQSEVKKKFEIYKKYHISCIGNQITVQLFSLDLKNCPQVTAKFPLFSLSGKSNNKIPCFPYAVATLLKCKA